MPFVLMPALPSNSDHATRLLVEFLVDSLWPSALQLKNKIAAHTKLTLEPSADIVGTKDVFSLCCSQIQKCVLHLLEIFQIEHRSHVVLQESRDCTLERLSWCLEKLHLVQKNLEKISQEHEKSPNENGRRMENSDGNMSHSCSILATPTYFVNWIDHSLELVTNLSTSVYKTDYKESSERMDIWTNELIDIVSDLHTSIDELLLSAMTLCRYCLPSDQTVITVRCQVVLREAKKLISEIIEGDVDKAYQVTKDSLRLPLKPTYINVSIDMLKSALYVLETSTNTALLALLIQCLSTPLSPLKNLEEHFKEGNKDKCPCNDVDTIDDCALVKQFDFYNERLMQIGGFSISCSSDENRILSLKSGLASLEALDPQLVPALMLAPASLDTRFLTAAWRQEVIQIRANIFLIVDPLAFSEKVKELMNKKILELIKGNKYSNADVCAIINMGEIVLDFFKTYRTQEPEALVEHNRLDPLLVDLQKALKECKTVSNLSSADSEDFLYEIAPTKQSTKKVTFEQLIKRLKLLFTIVNRINGLFSDEDESRRNIFNTDDSENAAPNLTQTIMKEKQTPVKNGRHLVNNLSKNMFAREASIHQYSPSKCIISKMTKHLNAKKMQKSLSFSVQLDDLFSDLSAYTEKQNEDIASCTINMHNGSMNMNNGSILYNFPVSQRDSMRKGVLKRKFTKTLENSVIQTHTLLEDKSQVEYELEASTDVMDSTTQFQITEILDQLSNLSKVIHLESQADCNKSVININGETPLVRDNPSPSNIVTLSINNCKQNAKNVWNIQVNHSDVGDSQSEFSITSSTQSNVTTFERLNDIDLLEDKLNQLKSSNV